MRRPAILALCLALALLAAGEGRGREALVAAVGPLLATPPDRRRSR